MDLMIPRWRVKSLWPACETMGFKKLGDIITDDGKSRCVNQEGMPVIPIHWELFPALFEKVEWWEDRKPEEMPQYVKYAGDSSVRKVECFDLKTTSAWFMYLEDDISPYCPGGTALENTHWMPATEAEYLAYEAQQKRKSNE